MDPGISVQDLNFTETQRSLQKFLEPERKPKVIYTDNSLEFGKACEDLSWNHCTSTPHRSETNGIAERAVRRVKKGTSAVLLQSGLNESWWADSMECYTYLRNVTDLLSDGKTPYERRFGKLFKETIIPFCSLLSITLSLRRTMSRIHQFGKKVLPGVFLGYALYAGRIWKGDILVADTEGLETMDASEIYSKRLNAKEVIFPKQGEFIFPVADWTNQASWRRSGSENIHLDTGNDQFEEESHVDFLGESEGSLPQPQDSLLDAGEVIKWYLVRVRKLHTPPSRWTKSQTLLAERRIIPGSTQVHWCNQNYSIRIWMLSKRSALMIIGTLMALETCLNLGQGSHNLLYSMKNLLTDIHGSGVRLTRKQLTSRPDHLWPELWKSMGKNAKLKEKQKWSEEKIHLDNARKLRGIYFIDPEDKEFKETIKKRT